MEFWHSVARQEIFFTATLQACLMFLEDDGMVLEGFFPPCLQRKSHIYCFADKKEKKPNVSLTFLFSKGLCEPCGAVNQHSRGLSA